MYDENAVSYMLDRAATLIMTDFRNSNDPDHATTIGISNSEENANNRVVFYKISLIGLNILKSWIDFQKYVLNHLKHLFFDKKIKSEEVPKSKNINWSQTFENIYNGNQAIIFKKSKIGILDGEYIIPYKIFLEYYIHTEEILKYFSMNKCPKNYQQIIVKLKEINSILFEAKKSFDKWYSQYETIQLFVLKLRSEFGIVLTNSTDNKFEESLFSYIRNLSPEYKNSGINSLLTQHALHWRNDYFNFDTRIGLGKDILITPTTDVPHLFELWCFCEFIFVLLQKQKIAVSQYCYINPKRNLELLAVSDGGKVYYNYMGNKTSHNTMLSSNILKRTCVEWYIEYKGRKIVFDTKYKKWNSSDNLTVLGYMKDFQANIGIVIFSNNFEQDAYCSKKGNENIICTHQENEKFIALRLRPMPQHQTENHETLSLLISYLFD